MPHTWQQAIRGTHYFFIFMVPSIRIALRYLFSRKSHSAVNVISAVSVAGVALATAAMVVVLSVFNGFHSLMASRLSELDPALKIESREGRAFATSDSMAAVIASLPGVAAAIPTIEQRALAIVNGLQTPVRVKGVDSKRYYQVASLESAIIDGQPWLNYHPEGAPAILSVGVANALRAPIGTEQLLGLYAPRRLGRINPANPLSAFRTDSVAMSAVFAVNQPEFDSDMIYVPIEVARRLFQYTTEATAIEVATDTKQDLTRVKAEIAATLPDGFTVSDRMEQHASSFRIVNVEKWMSFLLLVFIMIIASFNVISTMALLIIEKEDNAMTLRAIGASHGFIRRIYAFEGFGVTMAGGVAGCIIGSLLCMGQEKFGWIGLGGDPAAMSVSAYPVELHLTDLLPIIIITAAVGVATAAIAARRA